MTTTAIERSFFDVVIGEPLTLAKDQPHQILLSTGSIALMGSFASSSGILSPLAGYCIAIGVEWAYLRGLASDSRAQTRWGGVLNWSAFVIVVLWGVLWCAQRFGVFVEASGGWWLAAAHVVPVAWLSLCSAQCHRAALTAERKETQRQQEYQAELQRQRDAQQLAIEAEWRRAQIALDVERQRAELRASVRAGRTNSAAGTAANSVANTPPNTDRAQIRRTVTERLREQPGANRSELARSLGIGRTTLYELISEAKQAGELPE